MSRVVRSIAALALAAGALPGAAWVQETTTPGHPESGICLTWRSRAHAYQVNATSSSYTPCGDAAAAGAAVDAGLAQWGQAKRLGQSTACTDFAFQAGAPTTQIKTGNDGVNLVVFRAGRCSEVMARLGVTDPCTGTMGACGSKYNCWDDQYGIATIGFTTTTFNTKTGELLDADMELFGWDGVAPPNGLGHVFTCEASPPACTAYSGCQNVDASAVAVHEAGHMLGLDHVCQYASPYDPLTSCDNSSVMVPQVGTVVQRTLSQDDVSAVCTIYPKGAATLTACLNGSTVPPPDSGHKGGGCSCADSSVGATGLAGFLAATALAVWRQRRRRA